MNRRFNSLHQKIVLCLLFVCIGCNRPVPETHIPIRWTLLDTINETLPSSIRVWQGVNAILPLKLWRVEINLPDTTVVTRVVVSEDQDRRETLSEFAQRLGACVVVNGGYFLMQRNPTRHVGLLQIDHRTIEPAIVSILRRGRRYYTTRGALGVTDQGTVDIAWVASRHDTLFEWSQPVFNAPGSPSRGLDYSQAKPWIVRDALHAGPVLVTNGQMHVTINEEVFFGSKIPDIHPRTAAGYTRDGRLILLVVDGRQAASRGVYLEELAGIMLDLGCMEAINLDGGGSSALVVNGQLLNRPSGGDTQREVMSALAVFCNS
jgi:hypothetical protein